MLNLLSNAAKFTKNGKIDVAFDRKLCNGVEQLFVTVRDTGIGMSKEHVSRLFQPFVQADPSITQQYGAGLGLTITAAGATPWWRCEREKHARRAPPSTLHVPVDLSDASIMRSALLRCWSQSSEDAPGHRYRRRPMRANSPRAAHSRAGFAVQGVGGGEAGPPRA
ncbi:MAG: ATP-binding protein [Hyphomonadaceae bacterium]